jgi:uncharacterized protein (UPF0254 family)
MISFPVNETTKYSFKLPTDFGRGGISLMDGEMKQVVSTDIWADKT